MKLRLLFLMIGLYSVVTFGQTRIKVMTYNLMYYPSTLYYNSISGQFEDRTPVLKAILDTYEPDIFMVCELENEDGSNQILDDALQTADNKYVAATFEYNHSSTYQELQQNLYYNQQKLILDSEGYITTYIRDINHYSFILNTADHLTNPIYLEIFVAHLKASSSTDDENKRLDMVTELTNYFENLPSDRYVLFAGDFNLYRDSEPAYQELIDNTNNIVLADPIEREGYWHNNSSYADIHTQSPFTTNDQFQFEKEGYYAATGGLDDRFDFIITSENLLYNTELTYVPDSYKAYGNNGNCFNSSINNTDCSGEFSQDLRDLLFNMSDHLPVVMELESAATLSEASYAIDNDIIFINGNIVSNLLSLNNNDDVIGKTILIYNTLGKVLLKEKINQKNMIIDVEMLSSGVYYITSDQFLLHSPLKFIKR